jgi:hypothetical protein
MSMLGRPEFRHCHGSEAVYRIPAEHSTMKESPYSIAMAQIAQEKQDRYDRKFKPVVDKYIGQVNAMDSPQRMDEIGDLAQSGVIAKVPELRRAVAGAGGPQGATADSGATLMRQAGISNAAGTAAGNAAFGAQMGLKDVQLRNMQNVIDIGNFKGTQAQAGMATLAGLAQSKGEQELQSKMLNQAGLYQGLGTVAGLGTRAAM